MKFNWFYLFIVLLLISMVFISLRYFKGSRHSTVGITHSREHKINAEKAAQVKSIKVIPGQQVSAGDLLIELISNSLEIEVAKLNNKITSLHSEKSEKAKLAESEIAFVRANEGIGIERINTEISQVESEMKLNRRLTNEFTTIRDSIGNSQPLILKLQSLKKQRSRQEEAISIKVKDILQQMDTEQRLLINQINLLERELALLQTEKQSLNKYATADGVVENVYVRAGEQVDAFTSLLSINLVHPTMVVGYQIGKKDELPVGATVIIASFEDPDKVINGKVIGYGAVVELPEILQKSTAVKSFGHEVFIEIPVENAFASGEKVLIR
jgi:multidrug resistance efflux pump